MLIIPKTTGVPLAGFGVPSAELDALVFAAALELVPAALPPEPPALELEPELDELPQAARPTAATAHTPTIAPLLLSIPFISRPSVVSGLRPERFCAS